MKMFERLPKKAKDAVITGLAVIGSVVISSAQETHKKFDKIQNNTEQTSEKVSENYITKDGNYRYYYNPSKDNTLYGGDSSIHYAVGATTAPTLSDIKNETRLPKSLTETDFFTNYINTKFETPRVLIDSTTGNKYFDYQSVDSTVHGVPYEGKKHWNIQRFLIQPHFNNFSIPVETARTNVLYDMYKYFLVLENDNRDNAWQKANDFLQKEVDPIITSKYFQWAKENYSILGWQPGGADSRYLNADHTLFVGDEHFDLEQNSSELPDIVLSHNKKVLDGEIKGAVYSRKEIEDVLTDYCINYRKQDINTARTLAALVVQRADSKYRSYEEYLKNKPLTEYKIIKESQFPTGYETWDSDAQFVWRQENPELLGEAQQAFTEQDREHELGLIRGYRFAEDVQK